MKGKKTPQTTGYKMVTAARRASGGFYCTLYKILQHPQRNAIIILSDGRRIPNGPRSARYTTIPPTCTVMDRWRLPLHKTKTKVHPLPKYSIFSTPYCSRHALTTSSTYSMIVSSHLNSSSSLRAVRRIPGAKSPRGTLRQTEERAL